MVVAVRYTRRLCGQVSAASGQASEENHRPPTRDDETAEVPRNARHQPPSVVHRLLYHVRSGARCQPSVTPGRSVARNAWPDSQSPNHQLPAVGRTTCDVPRATYGQASAVRYQPPKESRRPPTTDDETAETPKNARHQPSFVVCRPSSAVLRADRCQALAISHPRAECSA